jgi:hypothetical protein
MQTENLNSKEQNPKYKRLSRVHYEEIPMKNRSTSRSSSPGTVQDEMQDTLHNLLRKQKELEHDQEVTNDWRAMATKIDKILFYVFLLLTIISTLGLLCVAPLIRFNTQRKKTLWKGARRT